MKLTRQQMAVFVKGQILAITSDPDEAERRATGYYYILAEDIWKTISISEQVSEATKERLVAFLKENYFMEGENKCDIFQFGVAMGTFLKNSPKEEQLPIRMMMFEFHDTPKYRFDEI